jgi:hypothetical protein
MWRVIGRSVVVPLGVAALLAASVAPASAQTGEATVSTTEVEDTFFNPCTREVVDRSYTQHVTRRRAGDDYVLRVNWSHGRGVGQTTGEKYTMDWKYQQLNPPGDSSDGGPQSYTYRVRTTVHAQGSEPDYNSEILVRLRTDADGTVRVERSEATGIECS